MTPEVEESPDGVLALYVHATHVISSRSDHFITRYDIQEFVPIVIDLISNILWQMPAYYFVEVVDK